MAVAQTHNNKSPEVDGLPSKVYKQYAATLLPTLLRVYNERLKEGILPNSMNEAIIILLLKPGKDATMPDSYKPIFLLTADIKLLARVLATRLAQVIHKLVHRDQSGFIPTRSTAQNIRRLFLNLQLPVDNTGNRAIFSLDAAKAFNSVEWPYLWKLLDHIDLGANFISWVKLLYAQLWAQTLSLGN